MMQPADEQTPEKKGRRQLLVAGALAATASVGGWASSLWIKSPQQLAAEAQAPPPTLLTVRVEKRMLTDTVISRGTFVPGVTIAVTPKLRDSNPAIVTAVHVKHGDSVIPGKALLEVSGRPLFALPGRVPAYRDLRPGTEGKDVAQLQAALSSLGHKTSPDRTGYFGGGTKTAVGGLYRSLGYKPPTTGSQDEMLLDSAATAVHHAERALAEASSSLELVQADPEANPTQLKQAEDRVAYAKQDLADARKKAEALHRTTGIMLPLSEFVFLPSFPATVSEIKATVGAGVAEPLISLSSGDVKVNSVVSQPQRALIRLKMPVDVISEITGEEFAGIVYSIGDLTTSIQQGNGTPGYPMIVTLQSKADGHLIGQGARLVVEAARSASEVLVVPLAALYAREDGSVRVIKVVAGRQAEVRVSPGVAGDGYIAVVPDDPKALEPGDEVMVGLAPISQDESA